jgi:lipopolysaccharide/colanic/teichoic acid biosynthesis glycosyltransferase
MHGNEILDEESFMRMLRLERSRTERTYRPFVLVLIEPASQPRASEAGRLFDRILGQLLKSTRDIDAKGWYKDREVVGVIFTELGKQDKEAVVARLSARFTGLISLVLSADEQNAVKVSFHVYPEDSIQRDPGASFDIPLHRDLELNMEGKKVSRLLKRTIDITVSLLGLILASPLLISIAIAIKLTSKGPVFFRQERVGLGGRRFTLLKFRTMYFPNDSAMHEHYTSRLIAGTADPARAAGTERPVYKLMNDPRITPLGRFLRRASLDELPQLVNVLAGRMSLVGPRPSIPYEFDRYSIWHRRRVLVVKPGITGLSQVTGRGVLKFDEMVRLDIRYARTWSLWMDFRILWRTSFVVLSGEGAY